MYTAATIHKSTQSSDLHGSSETKSSLFSKSIPSHLLKGRSFLEELCHWMDYPKYIVQAFDPNPKMRMLMVVRWYLSALWSLYKDGEVKMLKPYNPILGEQLHVKFHDEETEWKHIEMICEQVSHHPSLTAFHFLNTEVGFSFSGSAGDRPTMRGMQMKVEPAGRAILSLHAPYNEDYIITYPTIDVHGAILGRPTATISGTIMIQCPQTNLGVKMKFGDSSVGHVSGGLGVMSDKNERTILEDMKIIIAGTFNKEIDILHDNKRDLLWKPQPVGSESIKYFQAMNELDPMHSWKVWDKVTLSLVVGDFTTATRYKEELEKEQRAAEAHRQANGLKHTPVFFVSAERPELKDGAGLKMECEKAQVWEKATKEVSLPIVARPPLNMDMV